MKKSSIILLILLAAVIAGLIIWRTNQPATSDTGYQTPPATETTPAPAATTPETTTPPTATTTITPPKGALTYEDALALYVGKRYQFDNCTAGPPIVSPGSLSLKIGSKFMLDNRDTDAHTIKVGTQSYRISKNGFAIATAPSTRGTYNITCDGGGQAQLLVQP